jgi:hypothetical protein
MKRILTATLAAAVAGLLAFSTGAFAVPPPNAGGGGNSTSTPAPPDYGDLWILYRNENGVPYVTPGSEMDLNYGLCQQPLPSAECVLAPPEGCVLGFGQVPPDEAPSNTLVIPVNQVTCAVVEACASCTQEVEFERDNVIRADPAVLAAQLEDATIKLATAGCVTLDPSGRPVARSLVDDVVVSSTVDSPLQNLAFYKKLAQDGYLGVAAGHIDLGADWMDSAARALGASLPKEGQANVDTVAYMNEILGLTEDGASLLCDPCLTAEVREEVMGEVIRVTKRFLDYSGYSYDRASNFLALPNPKYIGIQDADEYPAAGWEYPEAGYFEFMEVQGYPWLDEVLVTLYRTDSIFSRVFSGFAIAESDALDGFAQAADDTRAVINFMHKWPVPDDYVTPIPCEATAPPGEFDLLISPRSGLKVPVQMAAAGDGREGEVTVENTGPATAHDVYVMVEGVYEIGDVAHTVQLLDGMGGSPTFESPVYLGSIEPESSKTKYFFFVMNVPEATEIQWTATAIPVDDAYSANNVVEKITNVRKPQGGGGSNH